MPELSLQACADYMNAELSGPDVRFSSVSTDTRTLEKGQLFVALIGEHFDAHEKVDASIAERAVGLVVKKPLQYGATQLLVADTLQALGDIARLWRSQIDAPVVAITGSNGKTTVKEMTAAILRQRGNVFATVGNLNNEVGMPLSLISTDTSHDFVVLELGANHAGEIGYLTGIARPLVALVNNAGPSHLEGFGSLDGVARAKGEIYSGLGSDGVALINADDAYADYWREAAANRRIVTFGMHSPADVCGERTTSGSLKIHHAGDSVEFGLPLPGQHNAMNALAATAAALEVGVSLDEVAQGLSAMQGVRGRLQFRAGRNGAQIIDDTYNANPGSLRVAVEVLMESPRKHKICVLGDMRELGDNAAAIHREVGALVKTMGVDQLYAVGEFANDTAGGFGNGASVFNDKDSLAMALRELLQSRHCILVKGSRGARMEDVVTALVSERIENNKNKPRAN